MSGTLSSLISIIIGSVVALAGSGGVVFVALRHNREEASGFLEIMQRLNDELEDALVRTKTERDELIAEIAELRNDCRLLNDHVKRLTATIEGAGLTA